MTREEKCQLFEKKGYRYNPETGEITNSRNKIVKTMCGTGGHIVLFHRGKDKWKDRMKLYAHHFAWFIPYNECNEDLFIDHINRNPQDNRISNLRLVNHTQNVHNSDRIDNARDYAFDKKTGKWMSCIGLKGRNKNLGRFSTEQETRQAYLSALSFYYPDRYNELKNKNLI